MLQTIREHTQGWIAGIIIGAIILSFALWGIHSYFIGGSGTVNVAEVNNIEISKEQLAVAYERVRRQMQIQYGTNNPAVLQDEIIKNRALHALIDIEVLKQASLEQGFRISDMQVDTYLQSMPEFQVDGRFSVDRFQQLLSSTLLSTGEFLDLIKTSLIIDQPRLGILFTSFGLPNETTYTIGLVNQSRDIDYMSIPLQFTLAQPISISADTIQAYYNQHQSEFMTPEQVNIEYLELTTNDLASKLNPSDTVLQSFYNENINAYTQPMQWKFIEIFFPVSNAASQEEMVAAQTKATAFLQGLQNGAEVADLAKRYTAVVKTQDWLTLNQVSTDLQKAIANLTHPNAVSPIIRTTKGFVILRAIDIQEPRIEPFASVIPKVKEMYIRQHAEEKFAELRDQLADAVYEHPETLQVAAKTFNLPVKTSELFTKEKGGKDISQYKKVRDTAFSNDILNLQNNSDVIQINPETVIVLRLKSHVASTLLPLKDITPQIAEKLKTEEAEKRLAQFANDVAAKLNAGQDPQQIANTYHFTWHQAGFMGRYSNTIDSAILDLAFQLPNPAQIKGKLVFGATRLPSGYAIVALKSVKEGAIEDKKQYAIFAEQIQNSEGLLEYELYKQSETNQARIKIFKQN